MTSRKKRRKKSEEKMRGLWNRSVSSAGLWSSMYQDKWETKDLILFTAWSIKVLLTKDIANFESKNKNG